MRPPQGLPCEGSFSSNEGVNKANERNWCQNHLADQKLCYLLEKIDTETAEATRGKGCPHCGGKLHLADYERKPRGGPGWDRRHSFCCAAEGCRRRRTPPSVRFLGRRVYAGFVVVLMSAMVHGLKPERVRSIQEKLGIDRRTLERWRGWWLSGFVEGSFWKAARVRFMPILCERTLPWSLGLRFRIESVGGLAKLLGFLAPLTGSSEPAM
jgi:hypothetical protein